MELSKIKTIHNCEFCKKKPCLVGCPLDNDIPKAIQYINDEKYDKAYHTFLNTTVLMSICGRICPHSKQCEGSCIKYDTKDKVRIGNIEEFIGDMSLENNWLDNIPKETKYKVAVVGSGPAGLTCAYFLRKMGIGVTIYEKYDYLGGLLVHGIPEFRLPKEIVTNVTNFIKNSGIEVKYNMELGKKLKLDSLIRMYDAIFLGIGANVSNKMHIPGERLNGVLGGNELLEKKLDVNFKNKIAVIIGGGDVAIDVARSIKKKEALNVYIVYRKSEKEMKADIEERKLAKKEGIEFIYNSEVLKINGKKKVNSITYLNNDKELTLECDYVIRAIGSHADKVVKKINIELNNKGKIKIDRDGHTNRKKIFAGGDVAGVKSTVAWAARSGRNSAYAIYDFLNNVDNK